MDSLRNAQPRSPISPRSRVRRVLSLALYLAILLIGSSLFLAHRVSAALNERTLAIGKQLDAFRELSGRTTELSFNGEDLALSTAVFEQPIEDVLARFVSLCDQSTTGVARELSAAAGDARLTQLFGRLLVLRDLLDDGTGSAVCLAGLGDGGLEGLVQRAGRFVKSWDLSELGQLRFAQLRKLGPTRTQLLMVTADGHLRLRQMLALDGGDVPGEDAVAGARPARSTRLLSARAKGTAHVFSAYRSELAADRALDDFGARLRALGFERAVKVRKHGEQGMTVDTPALTESYLRGTEMFVVTSQVHEAGSLLSVVALADRAIPGPFDAAAERSARSGEAPRLRDPALD